MKTSAKRIAVTATLACLVVAGMSLTAATTFAQKANGTWTDPNDKSLPDDFKVQGEYVGKILGGGKLGSQVIALGNGAFQAVIFPGGLPGAGWDGKNKILLDGRLENGQAAFKPAEGKKRYLAKAAAEFSATSQFPPVGQKAYTAVASGITLTGTTDDGNAFKLMKTVRNSPTLGKEPPRGAVILFGGSDTAEWTGGRLDADNAILNTDGRDILTKRKFNNYTMHLEFMLPYRPDARGQGRGNSGFYQVDHYEVQVLDSFGLDGKNNECGGIYSQAETLVNMCLPPLTWQTYDVEFTNAIADENGKKIKNAVITLRLNGVVVHDKLEISGKTGGSRNAPEGTPGPIKLQGHGNPLQYRNIWIVEKK
jgi:hypothetical protein